MKIDPFLSDFCLNHSELQSGQRVWKKDAVALWRPGGCNDTQVFLPLFQNYLRQVMGQYINSEGTPKECFRVHYQRQVNEVVYDSASTNHIDGLKFFNNPKIKHNKNPYQESEYVFCPGEAVGTLTQLGFKEPEYARFAGASLKLRIDIPEDKFSEYSTYSHHMSVYKDGISCAWQARCIGKQIVIGMAGTKAFYGDQKPHKDHEFAKNRNLIQLNMMNEIVPQFISLALGKPTDGKQLTQEDLEYLEKNHIAERHADSRAVTFDAFPTLGAVYNEKGQIENARCTTHLGSGGASFSPAAIQVSRMFKKPLGKDAEQVLVFGSSNRLGNA